MARLNINADQDFPLNRAAFKPDASIPANTNCPPPPPAGEEPEFDLDSVFEEPSRRPF